MTKIDRKRLQRARRLLQEAREIAWPRPPKGSCVSGPPSQEALRAAVKRCDEAVELCPALTDAYVERSSLRDETGDQEGAKADALRALELGPGDVRSYLRVAFRFDYPERRRILRKAMHKFRGSPSDRSHLWFNILYTYWYESRFEDEVQEALKLIRYRKRVRYLRRIDLDFSELGSALEALGRYKEAEAAYLQGLKTRHGAHLAQEVVLARIRGGDLRGAEELLVILRKKMPRDLVAFLRSAIRGLQGKAVRSPERTLAKATQVTYGGVGRFGFYAAVVMLRMGREVEARKLLREYVAHIESNPREWGVTNRWEVAKAKELLAA